MTAPNTHTGFSVLPFFPRPNAKTVTLANNAVCNVYGQNKFEGRSLNPAIAGLIADLDAHGITLTADSERLTAAPAHRMTDSQRAAIRQHKAELLSILAANDPEPAKIYRLFLVVSHVETHG